MNTKETNPKDWVGFNKSPMFSYVSRPVMAARGARAVRDDGDEARFVRFMKQRPLRRDCG